MNRVGIITHFYHTNNYGGMLQSYALTEFLRAQGFFAEQLSYPRCFEVLGQKKTFKQNLKRKVNNFKGFIKKLIVKKPENDNRKLIDLFDTWAKKHVPHSSVVYTSKNIKKAAVNYDFFITGSDQVWNYSWYNKDYFLDFVPKNKVKLSYAASIGHTEINDYEKNIIKNHLESFSYISVREKQSIDLLAEISPVEIKWVVDPVFLLDKEHWDKLCLNRLVKEKYMFCYFLGNDDKERELAREYAKQKDLKIVIIKNLLLSEERDFFADICLEMVDPSGFISLIKNSEIVFTDSFHATAFSLIFNKQFFVFERLGQKQMNSRITNVLEIFEQSTSRFCDCKQKQTIEYILEAETIDYSKKFYEFEKKKRESVDFLLSSLCKETNGCIENQ